MTTETGEIGKRAVSKSDLTATSAKQRSGTNAGLNYGQDFSWTSANAFSAELIAAVRFKLTEKFVPILAARPDVANIPDNEGRTLMSYVASHAEGLEELMEVANINWDVIDKQGDSLLHFAVSHNCPMSAFLLAKQAPETCLLKNKNGKNPVEIAHDRHCGEVLNALLLGCCSEEANPKDSNSPAKDAIRILLDFGAVPDTWAPNGRSALMLAATADSPETIQLLLDKKADISLRDTLNRTALMFASASGGEASVKVLMENGGQQALSAQCNKGWNALGYAEHPGVRTLIEKKFEQLEKAARENEKALLAQVQEETNKETAKKQKKSHRGQKKKRKGKRDATVETLNEPPQEIQEIDTPRSTEGSIERDHINKFSIQEIEDESLMHEFDREEESQNARLECEDGALEDEFRKEAEVDKEEGFGKTNPVVLVHCDSRSDVIKDALDTMLGNQYTDSHTEPKDPQFSKPAEDIISEIGKQANLNQNYDLACSSDQIQIPLVEEEYESWERRYEEDDSTWQEVKKDAKKEARKEKRQESKKQSNKPNQAEEETLGHASRQRQSIPVDPITLSELQQSEDSTLVSPPKECPQDSIPSQSKPIKEDPKIQAMQEPPPGLSNSQPLPSKATDTNCSWANVVQGKANLMEAIMCSSMSAPELGELEIPQTTDRKGSLPHPIIQNSCADQLRTHPNFSAAPSLLDSLRKQTFQGGDQNPSIGSIDGSIDLALAEEVNRLKQENSGLLAQLTQAEVSRHQREELLQQLQQAHALELNQARHLAASNSKRQEAEKLSLQNEISRLQLELAKTRQLANRLSEVFTQIQNTSQNHQPQAAPTPFQNNMNLQQNNLSLMRQNNLQNLQSSLVNAIRGNTAQAALRQLNLNGNSSHTGLLNNVQSPYQNGMTPFQRGMRERPFQAIDPVKQIPQNSQPSLIQHNHQNGVQTAQIGTPRGPSQNFPIFSQLKQDIPNNEHAQTNGPSITPGSQTVREEKSPWNSGPSKFEGSKSGLFDSIWSMQQPSQSAVKPDTQAIWQSLSAQKEQQTAISL